MSVRRLAPQEVQPASFAFTDENLAFARSQIAKYPEGRQASAVIAIMWRAQEQNGGWLSEAAIRSVADFLGMPYIRALEVATFYTMFQLQPVGRKAHVQVCGTTPCRLQGAGELIEICKSRIHHDAFALSADGDFSWEEVECLGACVNAPMVMIWKDTYEDLTAETFTKVLDGFKTGQPVKPGPQNGRQYSAPLGGPRVLKDASAAPAPSSSASASSSAPQTEAATAPLHDNNAKRAGEGGNMRERPDPVAPAADKTRTDPPGNDPVPRESAQAAGPTPNRRKNPPGARKPKKT
jgi:NADH-quinone oxidoreductase subunit E